MTNKFSEFFPSSEDFTRKFSKNFFPLKKIFKILLVGMLVMPYQNAFGATMTPLSLEQVMAQNQKQFLVNFEEKKYENEKDVHKTINYTYRPLFTGKAIQIWRANEATLWMQKVDIAGGATVDSAIEVKEYDQETGEPKYIKKTIAGTLASLVRAPTSLINGQFFHPGMQPTFLSFGLRQGMDVLSSGAEQRTYKKNILRVTDHYAEIVPDTWANLKKSDGNFAMVNLTLNDHRFGAERIGRTFICLPHPDENNRSSQMLVFVATDMTEREVVDAMMQQGCTHASVAKLDGSGSSRLWYNDHYIFGASHNGVPDKRKIPHYVLFFDAK